jgi:glycosyltransferase involved in cell wall biosynthesis
MRVVHLIDHLGLGGSQALLLDLLEARGRAIEPEVWTLRERTLPKTAQRLRDGGVRLRGPLGLRALRGALASARPGLRPTHLDVSNTLGAAVALTLGSARPRIVCHLENPPAEHYGRAARWLLGRVVARVDACIVVSPSLRAAAHADLHRARRLALIRPGIDLERFDPAAVDPAAVRRLRGAAGRVVGIVARLAPQKGIESLLEAVPRLLAAAPDTRVLIVGDGPSRAALAARARRLGLGAAVDFLGYRADAEAIYAALDVMVMPSRHEGFGIAFLEAMAMGAAVVGTRVVGSVDAVTDGTTGLLVPPDDPAALAAAILRLFDDPELRRRLVEEGRRRVRAEGSREGMARRTEALYETLTGVVDGEGSRCTGASSFSS